MPTKRLSIIGVGLLGGSIGMAARLTASNYKIIGYGHRVSTLDRALEFQAIDQKANSIPDAVSQANLVILCTPVGIFEQTLREMAPHLPPGCIVTDVGSTKRSIVSLAKKILPKNVHFIGSHPMAGSEKRGIEYARADLFQGATCILTPTAQSDAGALAEVKGFWESLGMNVTCLSPVEHDRLLADISHLPHALAAALVAMQADEGMKLAGKGFLDTTRIAGGDGNLWRDILLDNRDNLKKSIQRLKRALATVEKMLDPKQAEELARWLDQTASRRQKLLQQKLREVTPD